MSGIATAYTASASSAPAATASEAPASASANTSGSSASSLASGVNTGMTSDTRQFVIKLFAVAIVIFVAAILGVLLYRAFVDGNAPLTTQITSGLINLLPWLLGFLATIIVGEPIGTALVARALGILTGVTIPPTPPSSSGSNTSGS